MMTNTINRIAQLGITLSVLFCAVSCAEKLRVELDDTSNYITVTSQVDAETKAGYEGTSVLPGTFTMTIRQGDDISPDYPMTKSGSSNIYSFPQGEMPKWKTSDVSQVSVKAITTPSISYDNETYGYTWNTGLMRVCRDQTTAQRIEASDLLGAKTGNGITISGNKIHVAFNHLMSKLQVSYTILSSSLSIDKMELSNVAVSGTYSYTDMKHVYPVSPQKPEIGTIRMFQHTNSAEAIFFPFDPTESDSPKLLIYVNGNEIPIECDITLRAGTRFIPGKLYRINISISESSTSGEVDVKVENWGSNSNVQIPGERVLWIGTSIPAGDRANGITSYPELIDDAMNCTIINNAVSGFAGANPTAGSKVIPPKVMTQIDGLLYDYYKEDWYGGEVIKRNSGLSLTHKEIETKYKSTLEGIFNGVTDKNKYPNWVNDVLNDLYALSYESLIIPYIDGTKDNCTTVILDHGFSDRAAMVYEAIGLQAYAPSYTHVQGYTYLKNLQRKEPGYTYDDYLSLLNSTVGKKPGDLTQEGNYIVEMSKVIQKIKETNPNVRIIIGNYFTTVNPYIVTQYSGYANTFADYKNFGSLICYFNEAVAGIWDLDIVNVQNHLWLTEDQFPADMSLANGHVTVVNDLTKFCYDGVHPWQNKEAIQAIADIYIEALDGVIGSRVN